MDDHIGPKRNSRIQQSLGTSEKYLTDQARQQLQFPDRFKPEKPNLSYADLRPELTKDVNHISPKPSGNHQKQHRKAIEEKELVKYMSNLPSYVERGENRLEKVLNVGVLDWGRLERWQCSQPQRSSRHSLSSINSSSYFTAEGLSVFASRGQNCSPGRQRMRRPSLQFHLMSSPMEGHSQAIRSLEESSGNSQEVKDSQINALNERGKFIMTDRPSSKNHAEIKPDQCKRKDSDPKINRKSRTLANGLSYGDRLGVKMKTKTNTGTETRGEEFTKEAEKLQEKISYTADKDVSQKKEAIVLLRPRKDILLDNHSRVSHPYDSTAVLEEASQRSFFDMHQEIFLPAVSSGVPHSCPLPFDIDRHSEMPQCSKDAESLNCLPEQSHSITCPAKIAVASLDDKSSEIKGQTVTLTNSSSQEHSTGSDPKLSKVVTEKVRSTSPFRRLSIGMGKITKTFSSKEGLVKPPSSSKRDCAKPGSENAVASFALGTSSSDTQNATSRARSSPLKRLLDPVWKAKGPNCHHSRESLQKGAVSTDRTCKSSNAKLNYLTGTAQVGVVKLDTSCTAINVNDSSRDKKHSWSTSQALLRVTIKNGQPLFTFAVDNAHDILAATVKKLSTSRKDDYSCMYTFFAIQEMKKKNGRWIHQGGKGKGHDYIPNVVAQLKVSGSQFANLTRQNYIEQSFAREFVLFSVDLGQAEQQTLDFQPKDELAAILLKVAKVTYRNAIRDVNQTDKCKDLPEAKLNSILGDLQNQPIVGSQSLLSTTVILPSGVHSLPNKGGPSSLTHRWRSGGSCDCGGWDLGCKLRILTNQNELSKIPNSSKASSLLDKFELVSQGGEDENQPVFSLAPFKDGIYSVEFRSSLSVLQAFSLCIAVLDGKKLSEVSESCNLFERKTSLEPTLAQNDGIKAPNGNGEVPARYCSYPPVSPVGRV